MVSQVKKNVYLVPLLLLSYGVKGETAVEVQPTVPVIPVIEEVSQLPKGKWQDLIEQAQNAVVQVWVQSAEFNWLEPYKSPEQKQGTGSGFFINNDGYFLTNYHVVRGATSLFANISCLGKKPLDVSIVGVCPDLDVALLKLSDVSLNLVRAQIGRLPCLELGNSDELYPTEEVLALGYPLGYRYLKGTLGAIAGRDFHQGRCYRHITAAINLGNSGGPLVNAQGKVMGINTWIRTYTQSEKGLIPTQNMSYIVPINDIKTILDNLYTQKIIRRPEVGIGCNHATDEHTKSLNNPVPGGLYVNQVVKGFLADTLGIREDDMLYEIEWDGNRYAIDEWGDVIINWHGLIKISVEELLTRCKNGDLIKGVIYRHGQRMELSGTFDASPLLPIREIYPEYETEEIDYEMVGGAVIMQLRENHIQLLHQALPLLRKYAHIEHQGKNILVITRILPGSQMHMVECFYTGALIKKVNGKKVHTLKELREALMLSATSNDVSQRGNIKILTKDKQCGVLSLQRVLQDEPRLAYAFKFQISDTVKKLRDAYAQ